MFEAGQSNFHEDWIKTRHSSGGQREYRRVIRRRVIQADKPLREKDFPRLKSLSSRYNINNKLLTLRLIHNFPPGTTIPFHFYPRRLDDRIDGRNGGKRRSHREISGNEFSSLVRTSETT